MVLQSTNKTIAEKSVAFLSNNNNNNNNNISNEEKLHQIAEAISRSRSANAKRDMDRFEEKKRQDKEADRLLGLSDSKSNLIVDSIESTYPNRSNPSESQEGLAMQYEALNMPKIPLGKIFIPGASIIAERKNRGKPGHNDEIAQS